MASGASSRGLAPSCCTRLARALASAVVVFASPKRTVMATMRVMSLEVVVTASSSSSFWGVVLASASLIASASTGRLRASSA